MISSGMSSTTLLPVISTKSVINSKKSSFVRLSYILKFMKQKILKSQMSHLGLLTYFALQLFKVLFLERTHLHLSYLVSLVL